MTMYHMAMPPQFGGTHPPPMHSSIFPGPLLPPVNHNHAVHAFPSQSSGGSAAETPSAAIIYSSPAISQGSFYHPHQPSVYINPYLGGHPQSPIQADSILSHGIHNMSHSQSHNIGYGLSNSGSISSLLHGNHSSRQPIQSHSPHCLSRRQPLTVDEEFLEMSTLHLGYLETEDSPQKMEQREKLESVIMEYLEITPHSVKFTFQQVLEVLENSIMTRPNFNAHEAACAFDALAQYAANLISQPWRKEYREVKLHNGFWIHQVASQLTGAEYILELLGYVSVTSKTNSLEASSRSKTPSHYVLHGVIDPDLIARLALDCMIAYCECQCLKKIKEGVSEYGVPWAQILQFRQIYIGGVDTTVRNLLFTLRQRSNPVSFTTLSPDKKLATSPPPIPARQSYSYAAAASAPTYYPSSPKASSTPGLQHSPLEAGMETSSIDDCQSKSSAKIIVDNQKSGRSHSLTGGVSTSGTSTVGKFGHLRGTYSEEKSEGVHSSSSMSTKGASSSRVPTAKLIDLDTSCIENSSHHKSNHALLPKVLPHKVSVKSSLQQNSTRCSLPNDEVDYPLPTQPPPEAFLAGTLEEHLEASLTLVKNPHRNSSQAGKGLESNSLEGWDFVFKGLEKKGYNKDVGDRGDILHDLVRQKNYPDTSPLSGKNMNINMNNQRKDFSKSRPLTINQALQHFNLHETKERVDKPPSTKSSHSISHAYVHENHKRNSFYDNLSGGGFETANQDSEDSEDKRSGGRLVPLKKVSNLIRQEMFNKNHDSGASYHRSSSGSTKSEQPSKKEVEKYNSTGEKTWPCSTCTYENKVSATICEMCGKSKDPGPDTKPLESGGKQCHLCTLINERNVEKCSACGTDLKGSSTYI